MHITTLGISADLEPSTDDADDEDNERSWTGPEPEAGCSMPDGWVGGGGCDVSMLVGGAGGGGPPANHDDSGLDSGPANRPAAAAAAAAALVCAIRSKLNTCKKD
jgi:hypothetical protein